MIFNFEDGIEKRLVTGAVLIPDRPDSDGDVVTREDIERLWEEFSLEYMNIDLEHNFNNVAKVVGSSILDEAKEVNVDGQLIDLPIGTWVMTVKVTNDDVWEDVKLGKIRGFSVTAVADKLDRTVNLNELIKKSEGGERVTFADLGKIKVVTVSLVANPAVQDALFYSVKSAGKISLKDRLGNLMVSLKNILEMDFEVYNDIATKEASLMDRDEIIALVTELLGEQLAEVTLAVGTLGETVVALDARLAELEADGAEEVEEVEEVETAEKAEETEEATEELVAVKTALLAITEELKGLKGLVTSTKSKSRDDFDNDDSVKDVDSILRMHALKNKK